EHHITEMSGTSMASPQVAGMAGLLISQGISPSEVRNTLTETAIDLGSSGFDEKYGYGMINSYWSSHEVNEINIIIGTRENREFNQVASTTVSLSDDKFKIEDVPAGEYEVMAWIDVRNTGSLENGDYFATSEKINLESGEYTFDLDLSEYN
ncbi:MAG: S8 family serine peptidase, partial [bacterium]